MIVNQDAEGFGRSGLGGEVLMRRSHVLKMVVHHSGGNSRVLALPLATT